MGMTKIDLLSELPCLFAAFDAAGRPLGRFRTRAQAVDALTIAAGRRMGACDGERDGVCTYTDFLGVAIGTVSTAGSEA